VSVHSAAALLVLLPATTAVVAGYALRPIQPEIAEPADGTAAGERAAPEPIVGARRLAVVRTAVLLAAFAVTGVELLSRLGLLSRAGVCAWWVIGLVVAAVGASVRRRRGRGPVRTGPSPNRPVEWLIVAGLVATAAGTLAIAIAAGPNNWDSAAYHLPKVEQWAQSGSVGLYPASYSLQVALAPGVEYLLLHLRLLTGGDAFYNLLQWGAALLCGLAASRVAAQLGAGRAGQLFSAFLFIAAPTAVLEATSTQNDLVTAAWCACTATLVIDAAWRRFGACDVLLLGCAAGLAVATKSTGMATTGLLLVLWFVVRAWRVRSVRAGATLVAGGLGVLAIILLITGPFLWRTTEIYGNPLGPPEIRDHALATHAPAAVAVNGARLMQTATMVPDNRVNNLEVRAVERFARLLGENVNDPATTRDVPYPLAVYIGPDEDFTGFPLQVVVVTVGFLATVIARRRDAKVVGYGLGSLAVAVGFAATLRWQPFASRLLLPALVVAVPLAGVALHELVRRAHRIPARIAVTAGLVLVLVVAGTGAANAVLFGKPRALYGTNSVLTADAWAVRFDRVPPYLPDYQWAAAKVRDAGATRVGLVENGTWFEYPWWVQLRGRHLVQLVSTTPGHPAPPPDSVDAIICFVNAPPNCEGLVPAGWVVQSRSYVAVALPPGS
jgi:hypothetical protein